MLRLHKDELKPEQSKSCQFTTHTSSQKFVSIYPTIGTFSVNATIVITKRRDGRGGGGGGEGEKAEETIPRESVTLSWDGRRQLQIGEEATSSRPAATAQGGTQPADASVLHGSTAEFPAYQ
jgi:hypothetical protein